MKKRLVVIITILTIVMPLLTGCGKEEAKPVNETSFTVNAFDTQKDLSTMQSWGVLGKVELNKTETDYIKQGDGSAKVTVINNPYRPDSPYLYQALNLEAKGEDYSDFSYVGFVTLEVYNCQNEDKRIGLCPIYSSMEGVEEYYPLKANSWTSITYSVERGYIPQISKKRIVKAFKIRFDRNSDENEVYYLDNLRIHKVKSAVDTLVMTLDENEICSFDKKWQLQKIFMQDWTSESVRPQLSIVDDFAELGRGGVLRMFAPKDKARDVSWPGFIIDKSLVSLVNWESYTDDDRFCFDVYCPDEGSGITGIMDITVLMLGQEMLGGTYFQKSAKVVPGVWTTVSFTVKEMNSGENVNVDRCFATTGYIEFAYTGDTMDRLMYIDNIRMEINK